LSSTHVRKSASVTCEQLRKAASKFATGIAVVTAAGTDRTPHGMTVNSFTSVSCTPPIVSVSIDLRCSILPVLTEAQRFGISILTENQRDISTRFAASCDARFDGVEWRWGMSGVPLLDNVIATFECVRHSMVEVGDHYVLFLTVEAAEVFDGRPLLYVNSRYARLGS
jgi:flavin reductase (DIM6/NTAB) family NADH-FMN oxidoreductase RutF